jgi:hypothetical protein
MYSVDQILNCLILLTAVVSLVCSLLHLLRRRRES